MTDAERKLWWHLRDLPIEGTHFRRQATIGPYFADFACHTNRLVIEVDDSGHGERDKIAADQERTKFLNAEGYRVLRFWNNDVLDDIDAVMEAIYLALRAEESAPHP
jgi:very-short-patch-repair endonuclease